MKKILSIGVAIITGLVILAGYFFRSQLEPVLMTMMTGGILLVSGAGLIGIFNLLKLHILKIAHREERAFFSAVGLIAFVIVFGTGLVLGFQNEFFQSLVLHVQVPVETSLLAVLAVTLAYAALRLFRTQGWTAISFSFFSAGLLFLLLNLGLIQNALNSEWNPALVFISRLPLGGARGILLGMALGGLLVALRVLLGIDRPYGE